MTPSTAEEVWQYIIAVRKCFAAGGGGSPVFATSAAAAGEGGEGGEGGGDFEAVEAGDAAAAAAAAAVAAEDAEAGAGAGAGEDGEKAKVGMPRELVVFERHLALRSKVGLVHVEPQVEPGLTPLGFSA